MVLLELFPEDQHFSTFSVPASFALVDPFYLRINITVRATVINIWKRKVSMTLESAREKYKWPGGHGNAEESAVGKKN